ncbi:hypothetical protein ACRBEV_07230 [Methylobacterium phyllosphaerae]
MHLRWDRFLDRAWLALAGAAAVTVALHEGSQLGHGIRLPGAAGAVLAAQAAGPRLRRGGEPTRIAGANPAGRRNRPAPQP